MEDNIRESKKTMIKEVQYLALIFLAMLLIFKIHYYRESLIILLKLVLSHFYLFIIPGYCLMLYYLHELEFYQRFVIGLGLGYGVQPLLLYLINVVSEINILKYNHYVSAGMIVLGIVFGYWKMRKR